MTKKYLRYRGAIYQVVGAEADLIDKQVDFMGTALDPLSEAMNQMLTAFMQSGEMLEGSNPEFTKPLKQFGDYSRAIAELVDKLLADGGQAAQLAQLMQTKRSE